MIRAKNFQKERNRERERERESEIQRERDREREREKEGEREREREMQHKEFSCIAFCFERKLSAKTNVKISIQFVYLDYRSEG